MTKHQKQILQFVRFLRDAHGANNYDGVMDKWFYKGPADLLLREAEWFDSGEAMHWEHSVARACFRNAAAYALVHPGCRYVEGYAFSIIPVHHAWCVDRHNRVIEVSWSELGSAYFGVRFPPRFVMSGSVLFNEKRNAIYKHQLKGKLSAC